MKFTNVLTWLGGALWLLSCQDSSSAVSKEVQITETQVLTTYKVVGHDGVTRMIPNGDPEVVGAKEIRSKLVINDTLVLDSVQLVYWNVGEHSHQKNETLVFGEAMQPQTKTLVQKIPGTDQMGFCKGLYCQWVVHWTTKDGQQAAWDSEPLLVMAYKKKSPSGEYEEVYCGDIAGPDE